MPFLKEKKVINECIIKLDLIYPPIFFSFLSLEEDNSQETKKERQKEEKRQER